MEEKAEDTLLIEKKDDDEDQRQCSRCCDFPASVYFIVVNEFCERFCYYGMRAILVLYLTQYVHMQEPNALGLYHMWVVLTYMTPLLGGYISDSYLGKFKTVLILSIVYAVGSLIMSVTAVPAPNVAGPVVGLLLIALGSGGIKSCTSALGGDQIPENRPRLLESFFSVFYFTINVGSVLSSLITPVLRADVSCNGQDTCYPLSFGVPAILMVIAIIVFAAGKRLYIVRPPQGNVTGKYFKCAWHGFRNYLKMKNSEKKQSWLDYANDQYDQHEIEDVKTVLRIIVLFLPMTVFWSLFDQQGSRWTLQASELDGHVYKGITILPDQMSAINSILILIFIPLFESVIYPVMDKCRIPNQPLRRMSVGLIITVLSFIAAFIVQIKIEEEMGTPLKYKESGVRLISLQPGCNLRSSTMMDLVSRKAFVASEIYKLPSGLTNVELKSVCKDGKTYKADVSLKFESKADYVLYGWVKNGNLKYQLVQSRAKKDKKGMALIRLAYLTGSLNSFEKLDFINDLKVKYSINLIQNSTTDGDLTVTDYLKVHRNEYRLQFVEGDKSRVNMGVKLVLNGEVITYLPHRIKDNTWAATKVDEIPGNTISILWQIPQYILMTVAEVLVSITGLAFTYAEAPMNMKASVSAIWLVYTGLGNLIVAVVSEINLMPKESWNYVLFACMCSLTTVIFIILAYFYVPADRYARRKDHLPVEAVTELKAE